jgi:hypothetical protein
LRIKNFLISQKYRNPGLATSPKTRPQGRERGCKGGCKRGRKRGCLQPPLQPRLHAWRVCRVNRTSPEVLRARKRTTHFRGHPHTRLPSNTKRSRKEQNPSSNNLNRGGPDFHCFLHHQPREHRTKIMGKGMILLSTAPQTRLVENHGETDLSRFLNHHQGNRDEEHGFRKQKKRHRFENSKHC